MSIETMIQSFDAMFDPVHALSVAALAEHMEHPGDEHARLVSKASDDLYDALLEAAARLIEGGENKLAVSLIYQGLDKIRSL